MIKQIIPADPSLKRKFQKDGENYLRVSEFFMDTIQGEGINLGQPAAFLRMQGCTLGCVWCDTKEVWRYGNPYTFDELLELMDSSGLVRRLEQGHHLVLTGGSPLNQQDRLGQFLNHFVNEFEFTPYIEIENECVLMPSPLMVHFISCWNNSPKLEMSGNAFEKRYKPDVIKFVSSLKNAWFKFVVQKEEDWEEIENGFLTPGLINRNQIILMPLGATREELETSRHNAFEMAVENGVRYATREHIMLWDRKTGV